MTPIFGIFSFIRLLNILTLELCVQIYIRQTKNTRFSPFIFIEKILSRTVNLII